MVSHTYAVYRGGQGTNTNNGPIAGVFAGQFLFSTAYADIFAGFRCAFSPQSRLGLANTYAVLRGGQGATGANGDNAGIWTSFAGNSPTPDPSPFGFRCALSLIALQTRQLNLFANTYAVVRGGGYGGDPAINMGVTAAGINHPPTDIVPSFGFRCAVSPFFRLGTSFSPAPTPLFAADRELLARTATLLVFDRYLLLMLQYRTPHLLASAARSAHTT